MSKSLNKVILIGNLGAEPELRSTTGGGRVATLSLATGRQWKDASGQKQEKTAWHRLTAWNNKNGQQRAEPASVCPFARDFVGEPQQVEEARLLSAA